MIKNYKVAKFININGKFVPFEDESDLITILNDEIERLNNNWNDLEDQLKRFIEKYKQPAFKSEREAFEVVLEFMNELKEGNKNENLEKND